MNWKEFFKPLKGKLFFSSTAKILKKVRLVLWVWIEDIGYRGKSI